MNHTPDVSGPLLDHVTELYARAAFVEIFAALLVEYPDPAGVLNTDNMQGFYHVAADLATLARAVNNRFYAEAGGK